MNFGRNFTVLSIAMLAAFICSANFECNYRFQSSIVPEMVEDEGGFLVRFADNESLGANAPPLSFFVFQPAEWFASVDGGAVYFLTAQNINPIQLGGSWRGSTPTEAFERFLESVGLTLARAQIGGWVIGEKCEVLNTAVNVVAYEFERQNTSTSAVSREEIGRALFSFLGARYWSRSGRRFDMVGIGYMPIETSKDDWLVVYSKTTDQRDFEGHIARIHVEAGNWQSIDCLWSIPMLGLPITGFVEDVDDDGEGDFLFQAVGNNSADFLVSGADGSILAEFIGEMVAVGRIPDQTFLVARKGWDAVDNDSPVTFGSDIDRGLVRIATVKKDPELGTDSGGCWTKLAVQTLLDRKVGIDEVTLYLMPNRRVPAIPSGIRVVNTDITPAWEYCTSTDPARRLNGSNAPGSSVVFRYLPEGFE